MVHARLRFMIAFAIAVSVTIAFTATSYAEEKQPPKLADSSYDVIDAVNALRISYGLAPYTISPILMATAQNQSDYMAATGQVSHTGAGGSSITDRLLGAGYPLAGQLSLGGFRSENITSGSEGMSAQAAVNQWTGDSVHLDTMTSTALTEIGAGVTTNGGHVYYVIDCARPTNSGEPQVAGTSLAGGSTVVAEGVIIAMIVSTPNSDGNLIHEVKAGQTLWQIAISYNTKIDEIKSLNNLFDNNIYPGMKLLIRPGVNLTPTLPIDIATVHVTLSPTNLPTSTGTLHRTAVISTPFSASSPASTNRIVVSVIGIIAVALLGGSVFAWLGNTKK